MKIYSEAARALSENSIKTIPMCNFAAGVSCCYSVGPHLVCGTAVRACPGTAVTELSSEPGAPTGHRAEPTPSASALSGLPNGHEGCPRKCSFVLTEPVWGCAQDVLALRISDEK